MPGVRLPGQARDLSEALTRQTGCPVHVTGDADSARAGAFLGAPGVVVIAGTGSMASGWNGESSARAGGHGFLLGDEGGAYWIGRAAVRAALRWEDGMSGGSERIHRAVIQATGQGLDALIGEVCTHPAERDRLTALAPVVTALAAEDPEARKYRAAGRGAPGRPGRGHPAPPRAAAGRRGREGIQRPGHLGPLRRADRRRPPARRRHRRRRPARRPAAAQAASSRPACPWRLTAWTGSARSSTRRSASGGIPGAVAAVGRGPVTLGRWVTGQADAIAGRPMQADTVFDLASLTKVVATTTVTLALAGRGQLGLGDPVAGYLPGFAACRDGRVTVAHLLTHTSGLPGSRTLLPLVRLPR